MSSYGASARSGSRTDDWTEVAGDGVGIVLPHYCRRDGIVVSVSASHGRGWRASHPDGEHLMLSDLGEYVSPHAAMLAVDAALPLGGDKHELTAREVELELEAVKACWVELRGLSPAARVRVVSWLEDWVARDWPC